MNNIRLGVVFVVISPQIQGGLFAATHFVNVSPLPVYDIDPNQEQGVFSIYLQIYMKWRTWIKNQKITLQNDNQRGAG